MVDAASRLITNLRKHFEIRLNMVAVQRCRLEDSFEHKERVDLQSATIKHVLPQTLSEEWAVELNGDSKSIHSELVDTFGNLTLTGYNAELSNIPFPDKKEKLANTHIELNRSILEQTHWGEAQIRGRARHSQQGLGNVAGSTNTDPRILSDRGV
jgi:hypothetical protein